MNEDLNTTQPGLTTCSRCGEPFRCGMQAGDSNCWCAEMPPIGQTLAAYSGCLCPACLKEMIAHRQTTGGSCC